MPTMVAKLGLLFCLVLPVLSAAIAAQCHLTSALAARTSQTVALPDAPSAHQTMAGPAAAARAASPHTDDPKVRLSLLSPVSSKSPSGSSFLARLENPVQVDGTTVLPQGSVVEGHLETVRARRIMRPGALRMIFDRVKLPDGTIQRASFVVVSSESKSVKIDDEGELHPTMSKKRLAFQLGGTAAVAKLADDIAEEAVAAGAGTARLYGLAGAGLFLVLQKGREVKLHEGDVIEAEVTREALPGNSIGPPSLR
jgi:hypothetical protein